jgi:hypothetical protein
VTDRIGATKRGDTDNDPDWGRVPIDSTIELKGRFAKPGSKDEEPVELRRRRPRSPPATRCTSRRFSEARS